MTRSARCAGILRTNGLDRGRCRRGRGERGSAPAATRALLSGCAVVIWVSALSVRGLLVILAAAWLALFFPATDLFAALTHWCLEPLVPGSLNGHAAGHAATIVPALVLTASVASVGAGVVRFGRALRRLVSGSVGRGPGDSVILGGGGVVLAVAGVRRPRMLVSAGAVLALDDAGASCWRSRASVGRGCWSQRGQCWRSTTTSSPPDSPTNAPTLSAITSLCWSTRSSARRSPACFPARAGRPTSSRSTSSAMPTAPHSPFASTATRWCPFCGRRRGPASV